MMLFRADPKAKKLLPLQVAAPDIEAWLLARDPRATGAWNELAPEEYARAFTVARTAGTDIADDIYFAIVDNVARRGTEADFAALVTPTLKAKGWLKGDEGQIATRVALIYDTNLRLARASGRWAHVQAGKAVAPYLRAFTVGDERVRHPPKSPKSDHRAWDGIVLPVDHVFWTQYWPPLGFRCRCAVVQMTRSEFARLRGGVTSETELEERKARLGPPVFLSPAAPIGAQLDRIVAGTNGGERMPGLPPVDTRTTEQEGRDAFDEVLASQSLDDLKARLARLFPASVAAPAPPRARRTPAAPPPPAPILTPAPPPPREFRSPVNAGVNADTIKVAPRLATQKAMRPAVEEAAKHPGYAGAQDLWSGRTAKDRGAVTLSAAFDDEAASMIAALKPELDNLADQIGMPRLRGIKSIAGSKHVANQGDGILALNPTYFNGYASRVGGRGVGGAAADIEAKRATLREEMRPLADRVNALVEARKDVTLTREQRFALYAEQDALLKRLAKLRDKDDALWRKGNVLKSADEGGVKKVTSWAPGEDVKGRPFSSGSYFESGVDQARATLFHEFAHHVHQYLKREGPRRQFGKPPLERDLAGLFRLVMQARRDRQPSTYGTSNEFEWFAESFSLFVMGRRDLVDPSAVELIERIFRGAY